MTTPPKPRKPRPPQVRKERYGNADRAYTLIIAACRKWVMVNRPDLYDQFYDEAYETLGLPRPEIGRRRHLANKQGEPQ